jgi:hypothetical protein
VSLYECEGVTFCNTLTPHVHTMLMMQWKSHREAFESSCVVSLFFCVCLLLISWK